MGQVCNAKLRHLVTKLKKDTNFLMFWQLPNALMTSATIFSVSFGYLCGK